MHQFDYRFLAEGVSADVAGASHILYDLRARNEVRMHERESVFAD